jgi:hypothetical protein
MTRTKRSIQLIPEQRPELEVFTKTETGPIKSFKRAAIILAPDASDVRKPDAEMDIANRVGASRQTVRTVKKDFGEAADLAAFLRRKKRETSPVPPPPKKKQPANWKPVSLPWPGISVPGH